MNATILCIGTELLFGQITNTNAAYISEKFQSIGINVMYHYTVGDNSARVKNILEYAISQTDLVITTGGLGPTQDDLTKEIICETLGFPLVLHEPTLNSIKSFFSKYKREMTSNNLKQAYLPLGGTVFTNDAGTAPGFAVEKNGKTIVALPGPPGEMKLMLNNSVIPYLEKKTDGYIKYKLIRMYGIGESALETDLEELIDCQTDPTLATYAKDGEVSLRIASKRKTTEEAQAAIDNMTEQVKKKVGKYIYSEDDEDLHVVAGKKLLNSGITLSSAESCTGGLFAKRITDIPGISQIYNRGFVVYSNQAKIEELGVSQYTLRQFGAVSGETAIEMAEGVMKVSGTDMGISITGIAGPDGGSIEKPVGTAYICVSYNNDHIVEKINIGDRGRDRNRNRFCLAMFNMVNIYIINNIC